MTNTKAAILKRLEALEAHASGASPLEGMSLGELVETLRDGKLPPLSPPASAQEVEEVLASKTPLEELSDRELIILLQQSEL